MSTTLTTNDTPVSEASILACKMIEGFRQLVAAYEKHFQLTREEALDQAHECDHAELMARPPEELMWVDLHRLARKNPELSLAHWETMKRTALENLRSGHRAAEAVETVVDNPWQRACFLALREDLAAEWQPGNGIERQLIDTMAQAQTSYLFWLRILTERGTLERALNLGEMQENAKWVAPRVEDAAALEQAAAMADRFNRIFLRTLRALRDLRRYAGTVIVQNGGQVNVAQHQQVNVGATTCRKTQRQSPG
jgi:hypothetical protein